MYTYSTYYNNNNIYIHIRNDFDVLCGHHQHSIVSSADVRKSDCSLLSCTTCRRWRLRASRLWLRADWAGGAGGRGTDGAGGASGRWPRSVLRRVVRERLLDGSEAGLLEADGVDARPVLHLSRQLGVVPRWNQRSHTTTNARMLQHTGCEAFLL